MILQAVNLTEVAEFLRICSPATRIYLGGDSERVQINRKWYADYTVAIVVHIDGCRGCKVFGEVTREPDYDTRKDRPAMRLMNEVYKVAEMYEKLTAIADGKKVDIHLDINPNKMHGSSCVIDQAVGYIKGVCMVDAAVKPAAFAASFAADRLKRVLSGE